MTDDDFLFIWSSDHGNFTDTNGNEVPDIGEPAKLVLWNEEIEDSVFASNNYLGKITGYNKTIILMEQCFSGGFIGELSDSNIVTMTACSNIELSWGCDNYPNTEGHYDEFIYHFQSALNWAIPQGTHVDADTDNNGYISMLEAFNYAYDWDSWNPEASHYIQHDVNGDGIPDDWAVEHPQLDDDGNGLSQQNGDYDDGDLAKNIYL
jgi:hypothetical protein